MKLLAFAFLVPLVPASPVRPEPVLGRSTEVSYDGYHVFSVTPSSAQEARDLEQRFESYHTHPVRNALSIAIPPEEVAHFSSLGLNARLENSNLGKYIRDTDRPSLYKRELRKPGTLPDLSWFDSYHPYEDHLDFWDDLADAFPKNSMKFNLGKSYEGRKIYGYHLYGDEKKRKESGVGKAEKPVILWHATVHAREWISTMVKRFDLEYPN